ncbi:alpha/beta fold hydrolase [Geomicrobium sp. JCM 19038]|uniref:alpha/beta fold hydrolase n=1 Tax=Geomicrobium sp. JCM 19038 TaxID=1460635 RepID=UPI001268E937|nr:alpha/beta hydrolase [Geomicrobium sp. JCM 19038]
MMNIQFQSITVNEINLNVASAGDLDGKPIILLHGFPEFWYGWRKQIEPLAKAGYHVIIPDQRGYNESDKPTGRRAYQLDELRNDLVGLIKSIGKGKVTVIGHDWGGAVAWHLATTHPELIKRLITINIPHPAVFPKVLLTSPMQWLRSSYMAFFQLPEIPERFLEAGDFSYMSEALKMSSNPGTFTESDLEVYEASWRQPGAMTAMLNWYRGMPQSIKSMDLVVEVTVPTKMIWGVGDHFLSTKLAKESQSLLRNGEGVFIGGATHWVHLEQPELVNQHILSFIK